MKTIVQIVQHLRPGGIETMALDLHDYFTSQGDRSVIISLEGDAASAIEAWPRLKEHQPNILFLDKPGKFSLSFVARLVRELRNLNCSVLHTHHIGPLLYGGLAARLRGIKIHIHTEHDAWHLEDAHNRNLQRWLLRFARPRLVADAESVGDALHKFLDLKKLTVIPNGIDTRRFTVGSSKSARDRLGLPHDKKLLGCSGRLEPLKGQKLLIQSLKNLPESVELVLAGSGSNESVLREEARKLEVSERVHFLGRVDDMPRFYQALDLFCLPSFKEGMPLSPLEAQACGIPSIVTDVGGSRESLCPDTGSLIPAGSVRAIVEAVEALLRKPVKQSPRRFVQQNTTIEHMAQAYCRLHQAPILEGCK